MLIKLLNFWARKNCAHKNNKAKKLRRLSVLTNPNIAKTEFILCREYAMLFINAQMEFGGINNTVPMAFFSIQKLMSVTGLKMSNAMDKKM